MTLSRTTIILIDDHAVVRQGLRLLLEEQGEFEVIGEAGNGLDAVRVVSQLMPDVVVMDVSLPGVGGLDVLSELRKVAPSSRVLMLSMHADERHVLDALRRGATGYVVKNTGADELVQAIREVAAGRRYVAPPLPDEVLARGLEERTADAADPLAVLTFREKQIAHMVAEGLSSKQIAFRLGISPRTVEVHRANVQRKLGVRTTAELVRVLSATRELPPG